MKTGIIVQARMTSKRFPGKSVAILHGYPLIARVVVGVLPTKDIDRIIVAIPSGKEHEPIAEVVDQYFGSLSNVAIYRGPEDDVLKRYYDCANEFRLHRIVRITADCPYIEAKPIEDVLDAMDEHEASYVSNSWPKRTLPKGMDVEAFTSKALEVTHFSTKDKYDREHVTPYMQRNIKSAYNMVYEVDNSHINLCVDYPHDIQRLEEGGVGMQ
jgi:spore coat polysaccharide biosynthesis protein SpsF